MSDLIIAIRHMLGIVAMIVFIFLLFVALAHAIPWVMESVAYSGEQAREYFKDKEDL